MLFDEENWAVIVAAGRGVRAGGDRPKQFTEFGDAPLYWRSALVFARSAAVVGIVFVFPGDVLEREKERVAALSRRDQPGIKLLCAAGGERRQDSVCAGVAFVPPAAFGIYVHDAARPFVSARLIRRLLLALTPDVAGVIPVTPLTDTIKIVSEGLSVKTIDRNSLGAAQTPQFFRARELREACATVKAAVTDDASALESMGKRVAVIDGERENVKITNPEDLALLRQEKMSERRVGFGYDVHRYGGDRPLKLGGVAIPGIFRVSAHSDGDVLLHALMDAMLGCAALGDIGALFPDNDPAYEGISSAVLLDEVLRKIRDEGLRLVNVDLTVVAQKPKISPFAEEIRKNVGRLLGLDKSRINVKATTEEGLGFTGNLEGVKAYAVVSGEMNR